MIICLPMPADAEAICSTSDVICIFLINCSHWLRRPFFNACRLREQLFSFFSHHPGETCFVPTQTTMSPWPKASHQHRLPPCWLFCYSTFPVMCRYSHSLYWTARFECPRWTRCREWDSGGRPCHKAACSRIDTPSYCCIVYAWTQLTAS